MKRTLLAALVAMTIAGCGSSGPSVAAVHAAQGQCKAWVYVQAYISKSSDGLPSTPYYTTADFETCMRYAQRHGRADAYTRRLVRNGPPAISPFPTG